MGRGRPAIQIDSTQFENLCRFQCTLDEIASWFKCSADTVERWCKKEYQATFEEIYKKFAAGGKISLRRSQFKLAEKNAAMAIFLGKQYLGQKDVQAVEVSKSTDDSIREIEEYISGKQAGNP